MNVGKAIQFLTKRGSISMRVASVRMGHVPTYVSKLKDRDNIPSTNTFAELADVYGYDLLIRNRATGEEVVIDPPKRVE